MLDLTLLGTAALAPLPDRALSAALLMCEGHGILFDCGEGTQAAIRRHQGSMVKIDIIALTHYHGDHIFGLPGMLQTMGILERTSKLIIMGPPGLQDAIGPLLQIAGYLPYTISLYAKPTLRPSEIFPGWPELATLRSFPTEHRVSSQGYRFSLERAGRFLPERAREYGVPLKAWKSLQQGQSVLVNGREIHPEDVLGPARKGLTVVFSGDTRDCESLRAGCTDADIAILDATYGESEQGDLAAEHGHMTFTQAAAVARDSHCQTLWLTHYSQMVTDPAACLPAATAIFPSTQCGTEGLRTTLAFPER